MDTNCNHDERFKGFSGPNWATDYAICYARLEAAAGVKDCIVSHIEDGTFPSDAKAQINFVESIQFGYR